MGLSPCAEAAASQKAKSVSAVQIVLETKRVAATRKSQAQKARREMRVAQRVCFRWCIRGSQNPGTALLLQSRSGFGRQAPVKRCLARTLLSCFRAATEFVFRFFQSKGTTWRALAKKLFLQILKAVRKHLHGLGLIGVIDLRELLEFTHPLGGLGAEQVALAGMHAEQLAGGGQLEALGGATMGFQLSFGL